MIRANNMEIGTSIEKSQQQEVLEPFLCGLVLFDDRNDFSTGQAFLPNSASQTIRSTNDLRNDVLWISNTSLFNKKLQSHPVVRSDYYFKLALIEIAQDIGVQCSSHGFMQSKDAQLIATIATRVLTIAARAYGWANARQGVGVMQDTLLCGDIRKSLDRPQIPESNLQEGLRVALMQSYQERSEPNWLCRDWEANSVFVTLRFNYVNYVKQLLNQPVPQGKQWTKIEESGIAFLDDPIDYCLSRPCFMRVTLEWNNTSNDIAALAAYGQAGKRKNPMRLWISMPELVWLSRFASITITEIWVDQSGLGELPPSAKIPLIFDSHPESALSYSSHLAAYNHYQALTSERWNHRLRTTEIDLWGGWLKALDRAFMFSIALKAHESGFHVNRYGDGALRVRVSRDQIQELMAFKSEQGFMYPDLSLVFTGDFGGE